MVSAKFHPHAGPALLGWPRSGSRASRPHFQVATRQGGKQAQLVLKMCFRNEGRESQTRGYSPVAFHRTFNLDALARFLGTSIKPIFRCPLPVITAFQTFHGCLICACTHFHTSCARNKTPRLCQRHGCGNDMHLAQRIATGLSLAAVLSVTTADNTTCYNIDGSVSTVSYRCNNETTGHTTCCQPGAICYSK